MGRRKNERNKKIRTFWDMAPRSLVGVDRRFTCAHCLHHQGDERNKLHEGKTKLGFKHSSAKRKNNCSSLC
jgi:hypothetical protein